MKDFAWSTAWIDGIFLRKSEGVLIWQKNCSGNESKLRSDWEGQKKEGLHVHLEFLCFYFQGKSKNWAATPPGIPLPRAAAQPHSPHPAPNPGQCVYKPNLPVPASGKRQAKDTSAKDIPAKPEFSAITDTKHWDIDVALKSHLSHVLFLCYKVLLPFPSWLEGPSLKCHSSWATNPSVSQPQGDRAGAGAGLLSPGSSHAKHTSWTISRLKGFPVLYLLFQNPPSNNHTGNCMPLTFNGNFGTAVSGISFPAGKYGKFCHHIEIWVFSVLIQSVQGFTRGLRVNPTSYCTLNRHQLLHEPNWDWGQMLQIWGDRKGKSNWHSSHYQYLTTYDHFKTMAAIIYKMQRGQGLSREHKPYELYPWWEVGIIYNQCNTI